MPTKFEANTTVLLSSHFVRITSPSLLNICTLHLVLCLHFVFIIRQWRFEKLIHMGCACSKYVLYAAEFATYGMMKSNCHTRAYAHLCCFDCTNALPLMLQGQFSSNFHHSAM
jgi:hypothetical protein